LYAFKNGFMSVFETNIRFLGGLLSLYALTGDIGFRNKARHVADKLLPAFNSPSGVPFGLVNALNGVSFYQYIHLLGIRYY